MSLRHRLLKIGGRLIRHVWYFILQLAESHLTPTLFQQIFGLVRRGEARSAAQKGKNFILGISISHR